MNDMTDGKALGMIETVGLVPAVEAGDVAVKTAHVRLIGAQAVGGGLVSVLMKGDVAAVKASVDAGSTAAARLGTVCSVTVIARTAEGLDGILVDACRFPRHVPGRRPPGGPDKPTESRTEPAAADSPEGRARDKPAHQRLRVAELKKMKVTELRRLARQVFTFSIPKGEIKYARKRDLLEAFAQYIKTLEK